MSQFRQARLAPAMEQNNKTAYKYDKTGESAPTTASIGKLSAVVSGTAASAERTPSICKASKMPPKTVPRTIDFLLLLCKPIGHRTPIEQKTL